MWVLLLPVDGDQLVLAAAKANFLGVLDTYHALRTEEPYDWMSSRGEFRLEKDGGGMFVSANLVYNALLKDLSGFQLLQNTIFATFPESRLKTEEWIEFPCI